MANALKGESGQKKICFRLLFSEKMLLISFIVLYNKCSNKKSLEGGFLMKITFIGATHEVTGSCYYLEAAGHKFLVDCGMEQGPDYYENTEIPVALG